MPGGPLASPDEFAGSAAVSWIDAHCHLDSIGEGDAAAIDSAIGRARAAGVDGMVTIGTDLPSSRAAAEIAGLRRGVWAAVGVHPHEASSLDDAALGELMALATAPKVVAIGEIGLDYYRDLSPRAVQQEAFRRQVAVAKALRIPVVIHMRDAHEDLFRMLEELGPPQGLVFHCFSGGPDHARRGLELGGYISFAGNISYKSAGDLRAAAAVVPPERLLVETDAPYLAPVPHRGRPNVPANVMDTLRFLADVRGVSAEDLEDQIEQNAAAVFGLP